MPDMDDQEFLSKFYESLRNVSSFLSGDKLADNDLSHLARFIQQLLPICQMGLVLFQKFSQIDHISFWSDQSEMSDQQYRDFILKNIEQLTAVCQTGSSVEAIELEAMLRRDNMTMAEAGIPIMAPVRHEDQLLGLVYFGKQKSYGAWLPKEKEILNLLTDMIGLTLAARVVQDKLELQNWVFNEVMDKLNINLYVTEPQTGRILFMNETMKHTYGLEHPEGELCWRVLQNSADCRCAQCMVPKLLEENGANTYCWEEVSTINGRIYQNTDSLMRWINGSVVHVQQSVDITEFRRLYSEASMDDLTGLLNRRAGKVALEQAVVKSREQGHTLTVGMIDVNGLKQINDLYGHRQGDALLKMVACTVQNALRSDDLFFRLSGDEFIVAFIQCDIQESDRRMQKIRVELEQSRRTARAPYEAGFCYGLEEVGPEDSRSQTDILSQADEHMYEQKRRHHILMAEQRLRAVSMNAGQNEIVFDYDKDKLYDALVQSTDDYIYLCNMKTGVFRYPQSMVEEFDLPSQVIENAAAVWGDHVHSQDKAAFLEANQEIADGRTNSHCVEYRALNRRGEWVWLRCRGHLERDEHGDPCLFAGIITNLGQRNKIDHMTGLLNKFEFEKEIQSLTAGKPQVRISVMMLGLDGFKHINDLYDREFGDEVLRITAQKIQTLLPSNGMVYRLDGDEFGIILRGAQKQDVEAFYHSLKELFKQQQEYAGNKYYCTLSAGCASYPKDGTEYLDLFKYADYSLEYAKEQGRDRLAFFSRDILLHRTRLLDITELLRESVENGFTGFELVFQPQAAAATGALIGAEALARWQCDKYGPISPVEFIPLLEQSGLILPVGRWIFRQAVAACALWKHKAENFTMSINLSCLQLSDPDFVNFMETALTEAGVEPEHIIVELTESYIASSIGALSKVFGQIRKLGLRIAMDDFGTGYSALGILKQAPTDLVKIDRAFVKDILNNSFDAAFIRSIVELCHAVNIQVCLEGVETMAEYEVVRHMQLDMIQGYFFGRPMSAQKFDKLDSSCLAPEIQSF